MILLYGKYTITEFVWQISYKMISIDVPMQKLGS